MPYNVIFPTKNEFLNQVKIRFLLTCYACFNNKIKQNVFNWTQYFWLSFGHATKRFFILLVAWLRA